MPNVVVDSVAPPRTTVSDQTALYAGQLIGLKGVRLALEAMRHLPGWRLVLCGSGPDEGSLRRKATKLGVADRVEFRGWLPRPDLFRLMSDEASVLLFPCLHEEGGWAVAEGLACGLPVVCLDQGGPPAIVGRAGVPVPLVGGPRKVARSLAKPLASGFLPSSEMAQERAGEFHFDRRTKDIGRILSLLALPTRDRSSPKSD